MKNVNDKIIDHLKMDVITLFDHDIDMMSEKDCDYSFPKEHPIHISNKYISNGLQTKV